MALDPEALYRQLGRLIGTMPDFQPNKPLTSEMYQWLGRADALIKEGGDISDKAEWRVAQTHILQGTDPVGARKWMPAILYRVLAVAELNAPPGVGGAFIPVGNSFDAFAALSKIIGTAAIDVFIVDPYMDQVALTDFGTTVPERVPLRLLADKASYQTSLEAAAKNWKTQHGAVRPLTVRLSPAKALHDRAIFIDRKTAWTITQSLKDLAKRSPAEIVRADDIASLKISAYEAMWSTAVIIV